MVAPVFFEVRGVVRVVEVAVPEEEGLGLEVHQVLDGERCSPGLTSSRVTKVSSSPGRERGSEGGVADPGEDHPLPGDCPVLASTSPHRELLPAATERDPPVKAPIVRQ